MILYPPKNNQHDNGNPPWMKMYVLFKMEIFQCHISFFWGVYVYISFWGGRLVGAGPHPHPATATRESPPQPSLFSTVGDDPKCWGMIWGKVGKKGGVSCWIFGSWGWFFASRTLAKKIPRIFVFAKTRVSKSLDFSFWSALCTHGTI